MAKINVFVCVPRVLFDSEGNSLYPSNSYAVQDTDRIRQYIEDGFLEEVVNEAPAQDTPDPKTNPKTKARVNNEPEQENSNG